MIDMHAHLERGDYTIEWLDRFVNQAINIGITTLGVLEHSHRFFEFFDMYESVRKNDDSGYQTDWIKSRSELELSSYLDFIDMAKKQKYPIEVKYGLEVCYFPEYEDFIKNRLSGFNGDYITGSIHWIDGWGFDHPKTKRSWINKDVDSVYMKYYELMIMMVKSGLFDIIAHPDSIKCFNYNPDKDLDDVYRNLAQIVLQKGMKVEFNTGLHYRYGHHELGPSAKFMKILSEYEVPMITASDAHSPEDVGKEIRDAYRVLADYGYCI